MKQVTTYVGIDAHKKDLFIAMLVGDHTTPVTWQLANEPNAVRRLVRKLEREALWRSGSGAWEWNPVGRFPCRIRTHHIRP